MRRMARNRWIFLAGIAAATLAGCGGGGSSSAGGAGGKYSAEIRRTEMGIAHITAKDWAGVGYGAGYAQAQDNLCTMADAFLTYRGERSRYFGGDARAVYASTIGLPRNLDSDFFFRHVLSDDAVSAMVQAQPGNLRQVVDGFVAGYNRMVREVQGGGKGHAACRAQPWVQAITVQDLWRRMYSVNLAVGYNKFVSQIANAVPPSAAAPRPSTPARQDDADSLRLGGAAGIGSNMYGFGQQATGGASVLFGNPHWYWAGPDRFYQWQMTIPGEIDVSGVSFLGVPLVQIGFNNDVAWSHTVSTARRFGLFRYRLAPGDPTRYERDGRMQAMQAHKITVSVRNGSGGQDQVTRTLYKTVHGPVVDLGGLDPSLGWTADSVFAVRDINALNHRLFRNWLRWGQAKTLQEFIGIQKEEAALPWINTVAVGRDSGQVWYADIGAVPNVSAEQLQACGASGYSSINALLPQAPVFAAIHSALPRVPVLSGATSECDWSTDADSAQPGAIGPARMPSLLRSDYVANMNDSYWLTNATAPLTGYPDIFGSTSSAQSLRTRLGHAMVLQRLAGSDGYAGTRATSDIVRQLVIDSRVYSARFKEPVLAQVCGGPTLTVGAETVQVAAACAALRAWDGTGTAQARGSHVWSEFWKRVSVQIKPADLHAIAFDAADPLNTPAGINPAARPALQKAFAEAVKAVQASGFAPDAERGSLLFSKRGGQKLALYGGCSEEGYFTIACPDGPIEQGGYSMDGQPVGNSYMQVVSFAAEGVQAHTFLTTSLSDDPASVHYADYTRAYGARQWLRLPFTDSAIRASPAYRTQTVNE